jgi:glycolate oxidase FAD binding subunit
MAKAMGMPGDVAAAGYIPPDAGAPSRTLLRLDGFGPSVRAREALLSSAFGHLGEADQLVGDAAVEAWRPLCAGRVLDGHLPLWRLSVSARRALAMTQALEALGGRWIADWAGSLVWLVLDGHADAVRRLAEAAAGHATLIRAPAAIRAHVPALHPEQSGVAALAQRVRRAFDPSGLFETGRFPDCPDAD